jgi:uncharacterized protein Yka (UPF0111/DUF47 family)
MTDIFDFGFTAVDESELEAVRKATAEVNNTSAEVEALENKLNNLYNAILPLLSNLKANPEKDYIYWPNRVGKVEQFEDKLSSIIK